MYDSSPKLSTASVPKSKSVLSDLEILENTSLNLSLEEEEKLHDWSVLMNKKFVDFNGVRITPASVIFENTYEGQTYRVPFCIQNISSKSVHVQITAARSCAFHMDPVSRCVLSPGLRIKKNIHYHCTKSGFPESKLTVYVDEFFYQIPLIAKKEQAIIEINPSVVNFGRVDLGSKGVEKSFTIANPSYCATKFTVDVGANDLDLVVVPNKGRVRPLCKLLVKVHIIPMVAGVFVVELWVTTNICSIRIQVEVQVCKRSLITLHPNTNGEFTLIDFQPTYSGSERYETIVIYNLASTVSLFITLAEVSNEKLIPFAEAREKFPNFQMFSIEPKEGRINPYEGRILTIRFTPVLQIKPTFGWCSNRKEQTESFLCAVKILCIQASDYNPKPDSKDVTKYEERNNRYSEGRLNFTPLLHPDIGPVDFPPLRNIVNNEISVRLCLHGEAEEVRLQIVPETVIFEVQYVPSSDSQKIHLTNCSASLPLAFRYVKTSGVNLKPNFAFIKPSHSLDILVTVTINTSANKTTKIKLETITYSSLTDRTQLKSVGHVHFVIATKTAKDARWTTGVPKPRINPGITPILTHEVGFLTDQVTFSSDVIKPRNIMYAAKKRVKSLPWIKSNAIVAFPNDRPKSLWRREAENAKTIFKGIPRYVPPIDNIMTYSSEEAAQKKMIEYQWFREIFKGTAAQISSNSCKGPSDYDISCIKHYQMLDFKPEPELPVLKDNTLKLPKEILVHLTVLQLYNIKISPEIIAFGNVTTNKDCYQNFVIENRNSFPVCARLIPGRSGLRISSLKHTTIKPMSVISLELIFHKEYMGRFSGSITCVINECHSFEIGVIADVVSKSLTLTPSSVEFKTADRPFHPKFLTVEVHSYLNTAVSFSWVIPLNSPYQVEPLNGIVEKKGVIVCAVYFEPLSLNYKTSPIKLQVEGIKCQLLKCTTLITKPNVFFVEQQFNVGAIPFGLPITRKAILFNAGFNEVMFVVLNSSPAEGVTVSPTEGTIKARSCYSLYLNFEVHEVKVLNFLVYVTVQTSVTIEMKVTAQILAPQVEIKPNSLSLLHVPCNSWSKTTLTVLNKGNTQVLIKFNLVQYPQFKVSLSKKLFAPSFINEGLSLEPLSSQKIYLHFIPKDMASYEFYLPLSVNNSYDIVKGDVQSIDSFSHRLPTENVSTRSTEKINWPSMRSKAHRVLIDCAVSKPLLTFSKTLLHFKMHGESQQFTITNQQDKERVCSILTEDFQANFYCSVVNMVSKVNEKMISVTLGPRQAVIIRVVFYPSALGTCDSNLPVYLDDNIYQFIELHGEKLPFCSLSCQKEQIYILPMPLGVDNKVVFCLEAYNYTDQSYKVVYKPEKMAIDVLTVDFLESPVVPAKSGMFLLPVSITFCSNIPISIKERIFFMVEEGGGMCYTTVYATADNSMLTTYGFIFAHLSPHRILKEYDENLDPGDDLNNNKEDSGSIMSNPPNQTHHSLKNVVALYRESPSVISDDTISNRPLKASTTVYSGAGIRNLSIAEIQRQLLPKEALSVQTLKSTDDEDFVSNTSKSRVHQTLAESSNNGEDGRKVSIKSGYDEEDMESIYPMFPLNSNSEYSKYMKRVQAAVELWLYEQVFNCSYAPTIGSKSFSGFLHTKKDYSIKNSVKNILDVYEHLFGREVIRCIPSPERIPEDGIDRVLYIYTIFSKILEFINVQGALLSHVEPYLLMTYSDYQLFMKSPKVLKEMNIDSTNTDTPSNILSENVFHQITIQCWIDLLLQTYKVTTLAICAKLPYGTLTKHDEPKDKQKKKSFKISTFYSRPEDSLLNWLNRLYNSQRSIVWCNKNPPPHKSIVNFDQDLEDGLVLTTVTAAHCPFLNKLYFQDMFLNPETISQAYHNNIRLTKAWDKIHLGFSITPKDFVRPNPITMVMLVSHLNQILPSYKPEATIEFSATLNTIARQIVSLENPSDYSVTYTTEIIGDENNSFSINEEDISFKVNHKQIKPITVSYIGRKATKVTATLLMSGASYPPKFGRNFVFSLRGNPVKLPDSAVFNLKSPLNTPSRTTLWIPSPHQADEKLSREQVYDIWYTEQEPRADELDIQEWAEERLRKIPRRLYILSNQLIIAAGEKAAKGPIDVQVTCFSPVLRSFWLMFTNKDVGDFIVKITSSSYDPPPMTCLRGNVPMHSECTCQIIQANLIPCNRYCTVEIPCRNQDIWGAIKFVLELTALPSEKEFWTSNLEKNIGLRLVQWMLGDKNDSVMEEMQHIFEKSQTYNLSCSSKDISFDQSFTIPDVRLQSTTPLSIHVINDCPLPLKTTLILTSQDKKEIRTYDILIEEYNDNLHQSI